uniref:DNA-directed RNA polymerases I and III subunit RPAC1 n=2 Tax=Ditylum brightwellii TaxID=49249 RepID=A0A7S4T0S4_9STRA
MSPKGDVHMEDASSSDEEKTTKELSNTTGGIYDVTESGVHYRHLPNDSASDITCRNGREFLEKIRSNFKLNILERPSPNELVFEMIGVDVSFANALRRIMISDVPTVAIEHVYMWNNSSIVHDEVLAHRLGLVPLDADPRFFEDFMGEDDDPSDLNTVVFRLSVSCSSKKEDEKKAKKKKGKEEKKESTTTASSSTSKRKNQEENAQEESILGNLQNDKTAHEASESYRASAAAASIDIPGRPKTKHVYSRDLEWAPQGDQASKFNDSYDPNSENNGVVIAPAIKPIHDDILLAKLRPGQAIELEAHARRGTGRDHAKFSPVATASYRLMPHVQIIKPVYDELADELVNLYEPGVFTIEKCTSEKDKPHDRKAVVSNPYACTMSRNYMRNATLKDSIYIGRIPNHFIFSIESVGGGNLSPGVILAEALRVLKEKCMRVVRLADESLEADGLME